MVEILNFLIRLISCFIFNKNKRKDFRKKHLKRTKYEILEKNITDRIIQHIDYKFNILVNTFYNVNQIQPATGNLRKIQLAGSILLEKFDTICRNNGIRYWLDYGNLLGAFRNQGFIPWDDDIDIGMMRSDFKKLQSVISEYKDFKLTEWLHLKNGFDIHCRVAKFCFNRNDIHLFLDIFTYDYVNCDDINKFYDEYYIDKEKLRAELRELNMPYSFCPCDNEKDLKVINQVFNKYVIKYNRLNDGNAILWGIENPYNKARRIFKKETIFPLKEIIFEGKKYPCPNNLDKYLSVNFGDYMSIPRDVGVAKHPKYTDKEIELLEELIKKDREKE